MFLTAACVRVSDVNDRQGILIAYGIDLSIHI